LILGAIIVGSVEGSRIWGKELKKLILTGVQWSPNSKCLLFTIKTGEVHLYDSDGNFVVHIVFITIINSLYNILILYFSRNWVLRVCQCLLPMCQLLLVIGLTEI